MLVLRVSIAALAFITVVLLGALVLATFVSRALGPAVTVAREAVRRWWWDRP